ncbi:MAG: 1-acyl-sn-glycerol-3-phosphate acyltransferase [Clostridia bacterium]|nr:1-acyl-sn-glycerol-3-phosphate acyltransferase [Clostridia bacterium]
MSKIYRIIYTIFVWPVRILFRIHVVNGEKMPKTGGCIVCANHTSMLDVLILSAGLGRQIRYMAKKELFKIPLLKGLITILGAYPVDRGGADAASIRRTVSMIGNGELIGIFPQGTRHPGVDPATTEIKPGVGMITWHAKAMVVPAYIRAKGNRVRFFRKTELVLGDPIPFEQFAFEKGGRAEYVTASEKIFSEICALGGYKRALPAKKYVAEETE